MKKRALETLGNNQHSYGVRWRRKTLEVKNPIRHLEGEGGHTSLVYEFTSSWFEGFLL